jgi:hypothetical protein
MVIQLLMVELAECLSKRVVIEWSFDCRRRENLANNGSTRDRTIVIP